MTILTKIANELDTSIVMTGDLGTLLQDGNLPVLDLGLFVKDNKIEFGFYQKPCNTPYTILFKSALSKTMMLLWLQAINKSWLNKKMGLCQIRKMTLGP